jgi:hypothetical protein
LYCDLLKDRQGNDLHGIFYAEIDNTTNVMSSVNFSSFDKATIDKLFAKDKKDKKKGGILKSKRSKESDESSLNDDYVIEDIQSIDDNSVVLFTSIMYNYSRTSCDAKGNCVTNYYCRKSNVTAFKVDNTGALVWASNLDRQITYDGINIYDLKVINKDNKMYVVYGSAFQLDAQKKNGRNSKSKSQRLDRFEYAVFDFKTGAYKKDEYKVNAENCKKKDRKTISPFNITVIDNSMYVQSSKTKVKPLPILFGCLGAILCPPVVFIPFFSGNAKMGYGYIGNITPLR